MKRKKDNRIVITRLVRERTKNEGSFCAIGSMIKPSSQKMPRAREKENMHWLGVMLFTSPRGSSPEKTGPMMVKYLPPPASDGDNT